MKKIKVGDKIKVITGKFKGVVEEVEAIDGNKIVVKGVNVAKVAHKRGQGKVGWYEKTLPIHTSNVMFYCEKCKNGVKIARIKEETKGKVKKSRVCKKCGAEYK